jgi:nickel-dependent lactate racemase
MRIGMDYGREHLEFEVAEDNLIPSRRPPAALADPAAAVRAALEEPHGFPALRRALTPGDRVTVVVDERLPRLPELLAALLEHVTGAGVAPELITLLCPFSASRQPWVDDLPDDFQEVQLEVHDPANRKRLSYLATTRQGKRLYLNRTAVDADQLVVLAARRYDPLLGYGGAEGMIYPALGDEATRAEMDGRVDLAAPGSTSPAGQEAAETAWLLGAPFFVQVIEGAGDGIARVVAGTAEASREGQRLLDACWRRAVTEAADLVVASLCGDPARHTFADMAAALASAARVVRPDGRLVLLSRALPELGSAAHLLRETEGDPAALERRRRRPTLELVPALRWAGAAAQARIYLLSGLPDETAEELSATPLQHAGQVQRLIDAGGSCLFLEDAHKTLAVVSPPGSVVSGQ